MVKRNRKAKANGKGLLRDRAIAEPEPQGGRSLAALPVPRFKHAKEIPAYLRMVVEWIYLGLQLADERARKGVPGASKEPDLLITLLDDLCAVVDVVASTLETGWLEGVEESPDGLAALLAASSEFVAQDGSDSADALDLLAEAICRLKRVKVLADFEEHVGAVGVA